jgi:hypothetical protein
MKTYLLVPFAEKDRVKSLGARFDMARKQWYVPDGLDLYLFREWLNRKDAELAWGKAQGLMGRSRERS